MANGVQAPTRAQIPARTLRRDRWWVPPVFVVAGLTAWLAYGVVREQHDRRQRRVEGFGDEQSEALGPVDGQVVLDVDQDPGPVAPGVEGLFPLYGGGRL